MLQQTRVDVVERYFARFLEKFPTVEELASASEGEVLARWSGLGYYGRARRLRMAAREVVARGGFPPTAEVLRELPGVGEYTAAAMASICFDERVPVLDGNVERLLSRLLASRADPKRAGTRRVLREEARRWLDATRPGDSNQALMEIGATLCRPRGPRCCECPLSAHCRAFAAGEVEPYSVARARRPRELRHQLMVVVERQTPMSGYGSSSVSEPERDSQKDWLLVRRPNDATYLRGVWELPAVEVPREVKAQRLVRQAAERLSGSYGGRFVLDEPILRLRHSITYRDFVIDVARARWVQPPEAASGTLVAEGPELGWFAPRDFGRLPISSVLLKVARRWVEKDGHARLAASPFASKSGV